MNLLFMETCKKQRVSIDWVPMWEEILCSSAREREKRNMKCFPGSSVLNRGHKTSTRRTPTAFSDWRLPADILFWTQPGVASTWGAWDHPGAGCDCLHSRAGGKGLHQCPREPHQRALNFSQADLWEPSPLLEWQRGGEQCHSQPAWLAPKCTDMT